MLDKELLSKWTDEAREFFKVRHVKGDIDKVIGYNYITHDDGVSKIRVLETNLFHNMQKSAHLGYKGLKMKLDEVNKEYFKELTDAGFKVEITPIPNKTKKNITIEWKEE